MLKICQSSDSGYHRNLDYLLIRRSTLSFLSLGGTFLTLATQAALRFFLRLKDRDLPVRVGISFSGVDPNRYGQPRRA